MGELGAVKYGEFLGTIRLELLDMLGTSYISQHIEEQWQKYNEELIYRIYVTDSLKLMGEDKYISARYYDIINPSDPEEVKTADEVIDDICDHIFGRKENE